MEITVSNIDEAIKIAAEKWAVDASQISSNVIEEIPGLFGKSKVRVQLTLGTADKAGPDAEEEPAKPKAKGRPKKEKAEAPAKEEPAAAAAPETESAEESRHEDAVATDEDAERAIAMLVELAELGDLEMHAKLRDMNGRYLNIEIDGPDTTHIVGKNGETLNQLQYLLNVIYTRQVGNGVRITLDANNFRERREEKLRQLATHVAQQVLERNEEAVFDALPAFERRVVHKVLSEMDGITTYSEGEEPNRRVVIAPSVS